MLNLLQDLQQQFGVTYLLISHDLAVVDHICDEVAVLYAGRIVEQGSPDVLFRAAAHPYTQALMQAVPQADVARPAGTPPPARSTLGHRTLWRRSLHPIESWPKATSCRRLRLCAALPPSAGTVHRAGAGPAGRRPRPSRRLPFRRTGHDRRQR